MKVLYRMEKNPYTNSWNCIAVFPELKGSYGRIPCYCIEEGWNECTYSYYSATRKAKEEEYKELHKVVCNMFAEDGECIVIAQKITTKMYEEMCRWGELAETQSYFEKLGRKYGLLAEFRENGIC